MKPVIFLRIASMLTLIHAVLHTIGGVFGQPAPGVQAATVLVMKTNQFPLMGFTRSFWDFYIGMGLGVSIFLTVEALVFWLLSSLAKTQARELRSVLAVFALGYLALAANSYEFFFLGPVVAEILIVLCLGMAIVSAKPSHASIA